MATHNKTKKVSGKSPKSKKEHAHADHGHVDYITIWKYLVMLLVASVVGPMFEIQVLTLLTAFGIAFVKAYLVIKHFMHLPLEKKFVGYFVGTAVIFMLLFYAGVSGDIMNHTGRNWSNVAAKQETERALKQIQANPHGHGTPDAAETEDDSHSGH